MSTITTQFSAKPQTFTGTGSQEKAFNYADETDGVVFASDHGNAKKYHVAQSIAAMYAFIFMLPLLGRVFYEMLRNGRPSKLYLDIDGKAGEQSAGAMDTIQANVIKVVRSALQKEYGIEDAQVLVLISDGNKKDSKGNILFKASRHLIFPDVYFANNHEHLKMFLLTHVKEFVDETVDMGVYTKNRCFRLLGNHKAGSKRTLQLDNGDNDDNPFSDEHKASFNTAFIQKPLPANTALLKCSNLPMTKSREQPMKISGEKRKRAPAPAHKPAQEGALLAALLAAATAWITKVVREVEDVNAPNFSQLSGNL